MGANIDFNLTGNLVPPLEDDQDTVVSFNLPRKITNVTDGRAVADGAIAVESESCTYETMLNIDRARLLNEASLLLLPNTYKEGKLYSHKPLNGNGDFTATRATTATRVNSAGLVELVPYNLITYSEMFSNAAWIKSSGIVITPNADIAPDGTLTADTINFGAANRFIVQTYTSTAGIPYTGTCYIKGIAGETIILTTAGIDQIFTLDGTWQRLGHTRTASTTSVNIAVSTFLGTTARVVSLWGAQLVEGTSARDYLRTETRLNIPRVDYSLGGCPNILLEPQRTNLALQSSSFDSSTWTKNASSVTANATTSPSGIVDADKLIPSILLGTHSVLQSFLIVSSAVYTASVYAKKGEYIGFRMNYISSGNTNVSVNLDTGVITGASGTSYLSSSITNVGNGWYRITMTFTAPIGTNTIGLIVENPVGTVSFSGDGTSGIFLWGAQLEAGAYATSFIPTTTASVTRNADSITRNNIFTNGLITAAGGTWFVELRDNVARVRDNTSLTLNLVDTSGFGNNALYFRNAGANRLSIGKTVAGVTNVNLYATTTDTCKIAIKWNGSTADIFENGIKVIAATTFTGTALENLISLPQVATYINEMALFPTPLTDAQMSMLTSGIYPTAAAAYASLGLVSESPSCLTSTTTF